MAQKEREQEVLITGAGPVGLCAALFLMKEGANVELIDKRWQGPPQNPAVLLHPDTLAMLDRVGVHFDIKQEACPVDHVAVYEGSERKGSVSLKPDTEAYGFAAVVPMNVLREKLERHLQALGVEVHWNHRLSSIETDGERIHTEVDVLGEEMRGYGVMRASMYVKQRLFQKPHFLIGADGPESVVRQQLHLPWDPVAEPKLILVFAVDTALDLGSEMRVTRSAEGVVSSVWPLPGVHAVRVNMVLPASGPLAEKAERGEQPSDAEVLELLRTHVPWFDPDATHPRLVVFESFSPTLATETQEHTCLLGEAAHRLLPFASHSLNLSLRRAQKLAEIVKKERLGDSSATAGEAREFRSSAQRVATQLARTAEGRAESGSAAAYDWALPLIPASGQQLRDAESQLRHAQA